MSPPFDISPSFTRDPRVSCAAGGFGTLHAVFLVTSAVPSLHESEGLERRSLSIAVKANHLRPLLVLFSQSASSALSPRLQNNFQFGCPLSRAEPLSPVKAVNNAAYLKEEPP
jgi:hypothetical protein